MLSALVILTGCILLRMQEPLHPRRVFNFGPFGNPYPPEQYGRELRTLSKYHGNGECEWIAPEKLGDDPMNTTTLLVSYPGSGKRLAWRVLEALTGKFETDISETTKIPTSLNQIVKLVQVVLLVMIGTYLRTVMIRC